MEAILTLRQRGVALIAAIAMVLAFIVASTQAASAQAYPPGPPPPGGTGNIEVVQPTAAAPLARTGSNLTLPAVEVAVVLLAAGGLLVTVGRRRLGAHG
jgi:hypothetical protein